MYSVGAQKDQGIFPQFNRRERQISKNFGNAKIENKNLP
jgi:hypothetical protein